MTRIRKLPRELVDRIAAGEVVERPASAVKELVENALDAGAREVTVEIRGGGVEAIVVRDDGAGMEPEDLPLAFASHATSKLSSIDDLEHIASFGFRGEALASLGAVADCRIVSRTRGAAHAHEIECRGGAVGDVRPSAGPEGTTVEVRQLFRHVPARRKFLRSTGSESSHVTEAVERAALAHVDAGFTLVRDGKPVLRVAPGEGRERRIAAFHGKELAAALLPVEGREGTASIEGFVARPEAARPSASLQVFFLNGRPVRDKTMQHALRQAFEGLLVRGRHPAAFLFVTMDPADVDVNVHPSKVEVRFRDPERMHRLVHGAVRRALTGGDLRAPVEFRERPQSGATAAYLESVKDALGGFLAAHPEPAPAVVQGWPRQADRGIAGADAAAAAAPARAADRSGHGPVAAAAAPSRPPAPPLPRAVLQVRNTFLVFETADGLQIVDQHALHERVRLEELHERMHTQGGLEVQRLLAPRVVEMSAADVERAAACAEPLAKLGFEVAPFGPTSLALHSVPTILGARDPVPFLRDAVAAIHSAPHGKPAHSHEVLDPVLHSWACRSAVMAGDPLAPEQVADLLRRAQGLDTSAGCAHGRPTSLFVGFDELERRFGRKG